MASFPVDFENSTREIPFEQLGPLGTDAIQHLTDQEYEIHYGLTPEYADQIIQMALEPAIKEYCPNDCGKRFKDLEATKAWLGKGRGTFLLLKKENGNFSLAGYGWAGTEASEQVADGETTFAIRIGEKHQGKGLASPFARLIIAGASIVYGAKNFWLETWASNGGAVHTYHKIGFEDVASVPGERPSAQGMVEDTRLFMSLDNSLLNK